MQAAVLHTAQCTGRVARAPLKQPPVLAEAPPPSSLARAAAAYTRRKARSKRAGAWHARCVDPRLRASTRRACASGRSSAGVLSPASTAAPPAGSAIARRLSNRRKPTTHAPRARPSLRAPGAVRRSGYRGTQTRVRAPGVSSAHTAAARGASRGGSGGQEDRTLSAVPANLGQSWKAQHNTAASCHS